MASINIDPNSCRKKHLVYSRLNKKGVRGVSYHFESEAEIVRPDDELIAALLLLRSTENLDITTESPT